MSALAVWVMPDAPVVAVAPAVAFMPVSVVVPVLMLPVDVVAFMPVLLLVVLLLVLDGVFALMSGVVAGAVAVLAAFGVVAPDVAGAVC